MKYLHFTFYLLLSTFYLPGIALAQVNGSVSVMLDVLPDVSETSGRDTVAEVRTRIFGESRQDAGEHLRLVLSGYVDGLFADRSGTARDAIARPQDLYAELHGDRFELRVGASRLVWGRLDEFQPTDIVNPLDLSRFILEGRTEARLPVGLVRGRWFLSQATTIEAVVVPAFRPGRFDQLDEETSPFNLPASRLTVALSVDRREPKLAWRNVQGGARVTSTLGRVDVAVSAYRGFRAFPLIALEPPRGLVESFSRFTMIGGDLETVRGEWGIRGEVAAFVADTIQAPASFALMERRTIDAGVGVDRRAGGYRVAANVLYSRRVDDDLSIVVAADRSFARETRTARLFAVVDPADGTTFTRLIVSTSLRDNVSLEASGGLFTGAADDTLGQLTNRDFLYARLKVFF